MRLWVSHNSEVSVREQLATQIVLAISSKVLEPGEKLPSTRSLARRLGIHANTVSAAFRDLARRGFVEVQKGSGVFVRAFDDPGPLEGELELDRLVHQFLDRARGAGFSLPEIRSRVAHWLASHPPDHYLLIEADAELRRILRHEISTGARVAVQAVGLEDCGDPSTLVGGEVVALYGKSESVRAVLPPGYPCLWLRSRSVEKELAESIRLIPEGVHLAVVSSWSEFLRWAKAVLVAAGLDPDRISFLDARRDGWEKALSVATVVIADSLISTQLELPPSSRCYTFTLLPDTSIAELRDHARRSFCR